MNHLTSNSFTLYARHTGCDGNTFVQEHQVWSREVFVESRKRQAEQANAKSDGKKLAAFEQITQEQYLKERTK